LLGYRLSRIVKTHFIAVQEIGLNFIIEHFFYSTYLSFSKNLKSNYLLGRHPHLKECVYHLKDSLYRYLKFFLSAFRN
jgi:hypothetical protein